MWNEAKNFLRLLLWYCVMPRGNSYATFSCNIAIIKYVFSALYSFYLDYFSVYIELVSCSSDLLPAHWAQAGHASVPVALQLDEIHITELGPILQLKTQQQHLDS